ncbi:divergent polysaccharide deacetylase family protein [Pseudoalteromonas sp. T1lg65]|uniref:divergent polysaccharide deacetylase family protein n=1 Tax=Pseudoalteromonas sp. T1lg65 TaxID=2077101 RepID=UPI003F79BD76
MLKIILGILFALTSAVVPASQLAIVIDDIGNHQRDLQLLNLPGHISYSILPHTPFSQQFAFAATQQNKELLLHVPMQALNSEKALGPGALTVDMEKWQLQTTLGNALSTLPQVKGVNNHMGSALTQNLEPMKWTMEVLKRRNLYFLDSRTTTESQAQHAANLFGVKNVARHIFLDNEVSSNAMNKQWDELVSRAYQGEPIIMIAHPYPETYQFLKQKLVQLPLLGIELVSVSTLVEQKYIRLAKAKIDSLSPAQPTTLED